MTQKTPLRIVLASNNAGKIREFQRGFDAADLPLSVVAQGELGVTEAEEPFGTFLENALAKARHAARETGLPAMADDSGICADALGGAPGVRSARFAGGRDDAANNRLLVEKLRDAPTRAAHYVCVLAALRHADDPEPLIAVGRWEGEITDEPRGEGGFGYDPHFLLPECGRTAAELTLEEKCRVSHRAQALALLTDQILRRWRLELGLV